MTEAEAIKQFTTPASDWLLTLHNYTPGDLAQLASLTKLTNHDDPDLFHFVWQEELAPTTGTPHVQGFLQFSRTRTIHWVRKWLNLETMPFLRQRNLEDDPKKKSDYCKDHAKRAPNGKHGEKGVVRPRIRGKETHEPNQTPADGGGEGAVVSRKRGPAKGTRGGNGVLAEVTDRLLRGDDPSLLRRLYPTLWVQFGRGLDSLAASIQQPRTGSTEVVLLLGARGAGKSSYVRASFPDAYWVSPPNKPGGPIWYPSYKGEKTIVYDDFDGYVDVGSMLRICDGHPFIVQSKGSTFQLQANKVVFTSTQFPSDWWPDINLEQRGFYRRITRGYFFHIDKFGYDPQTQSIRIEPWVPPAPLTPRPPESIAFPTSLPVPTSSAAD